MIKNDPHNEMQCARCPYTIGPHRYESEDGWLCQECEEFDAEMEEFKRDEVKVDYD